jgi:acyl carrier protein
MLAKIPLTRNGKVDRNALPVPSRARPKVGARFVAPCTPVERQLVEIWQAVLCLDHIGIHDNFFELGGHSLAAGRIISRVVRTFGQELPIDSLFNSPTVAEMSVVITANHANNASQETVAGILAEVEELTQENHNESLTASNMKIE